MIDNPLITEIVLQGGKWLHIMKVDKFPGEPETWEMLFIFDVHDPDRLKMETVLAVDRAELAMLYDWSYGPDSDTRYRLADDQAPE